MTEQYKTQTEKTKEGWYWGTSDDGVYHGPFETEEGARQEMWADGWGEDRYNEIPEDERPSKEEFIASYEWICHFARQPIRTDIFRADHVLEALEERNEESVWSEAPPEWKDKAANRELELMLADALYRWCDKHDAWAKFRALS